MDRSHKIAVTRTAGALAIAAALAGCALPLPGGDAGHTRELVILCDVTEGRDFLSRDALLGDVRLGGEAAGLHVGRSAVTVQVTRASDAEIPQDRERSFRLLGVVARPRRTSDGDAVFIARNQVGAGIDAGSAGSGVHAGLVHQTLFWMEVAETDRPGRVLRLDYDSSNPGATRIVDALKEVNR